MQQEAIDIGMFSLILWPALSRTTRNSNPELTSLKHKKECQNTASRRSVAPPSSVLQSCPLQSPPADVPCRISHNISRKLYDHPSHCTAYMARESDICIVRRAKRSNLALHRRTEFRLLRNTRDEALHLLLPWPLRDPALQDPVVDFSYSFVWL